MLRSISRLVATCVCTFVAHASAIEQISDQSVAIQLHQDVKIVSVFSAFEFTVQDASETYTFPQGMYSITPLTIVPTKKRFHLFSKTFKPHEQSEEKAYMDEWRARGFTPESIVIGKQLQTKSGRILDARVHWISIAQLPTEAEALAKQKKLEAEQQWTWLRPEVTQPGSGTVKLKGPTNSFVLKIPVTISSPNQLSVTDVDVGFWSEKEKNLSFTGALELTVMQSGGLGLLEHIDVEEYLRGVLPSEMPASWSGEALKAQAVSARSEVLVNIATKHSLEQFDFCNKEHCRAYHGINLHKESTDKALADTRGEIIVQDDKIVPAVFSSNCGGWTESNETVWAAPANDALRGVADRKKAPASPFESSAAVRQWLTQTPEAFCSGDATGYRWKRTYSEAEIHGMIKKIYAVGSIKQIELGNRGPGGRLNWIKIQGSADTVTVKKELPIRRTLGGLPSAMFDLSVSGSSPNRTFTIIGGGRGHGVGLCQHGANGMALKGYSYSDILKHYFTRVTIERVQ